jgi:5-methylcytosine-specific restriction endonuclease McrA
MPTAPPRWCARCREPHAGTCPQRQPRVDIRPHATARGYDGRWQKIRAIKRARDPLCEWCKEAGIVRLADLVDHYVPLAAGGTHDAENLVSMCRPHHGIKTEDDKRKYPNVYGLPKKV